MPSKNPKARSTYCVACSARKARPPYSDHCARCGNNLVRNGAPMASAVSFDVLKQYRKATRATIHRFLDTTAVKSALTLAAHLLDYRPSHQFSYMLELRKQMQRLVAFGVTPEDLVCRVCEFFALDHDRPFKTTRERDTQLARVVIKLAKMGLGAGGVNNIPKWRHVSRLLAGLIIEDGLWRFAAGLRMKVEAVTTERAQLIKGLGDFT
jgi:hypothetical protein